MRSTTTNTRSSHGKIHVAHPPEHDCPLVVGLVTEVGDGVSSKVFSNSDRVKITSKDKHYTEGLKWDTTADRREYLQTQSVYGVLQAVHISAYSQ